MMSGTQYARRQWILTGPLPSVLSQLTAPMFIGLLGLFVAEFAETYFVAKLGLQELAALSATFPFTAGMMALCVGFGIALSSLITRELGANNLRCARTIATDGMVLLVPLSILITILGITTIPALLSLFEHQLFEQQLFEQRLFEHQPFEKQLSENALLNPSSETYQDTLEFRQHLANYLWIRYLGFGALAVTITTSAILRARGNTKCASRLLFYCALINIIAYPIFIFGFEFIPKFGLAGAAISTVIANSVASLYGLYLIAIKEQFLLSYPKYTHESIYEIFSRWVLVIKVLTNTTLVQVMPIVALGILTVLIASFGERALAAYGVLSRLEPLLLFLPMTLTTSLPIILGQNWGAKMFSRAQQTVCLSLKIGIGWQIFVFLIFLSISNHISTIFCEDLILKQWIKVGVLIMAASYIGLAACILNTSASYAIGHAHLALELTIVRYFLCLLPLTYIGASFSGLTGVLAGVFLTHIFTGIYSYTRLLWKLKQPFNTHKPSSTLASSNNCDNYNSLSTIKRKKPTELSL